MPDRTFSRGQRLLCRPGAFGLKPSRSLLAQPDFRAIFQGIGAVGPTQNYQRFIEPLAVAMDIWMLGISAPNA
ncbi:UNVERIFIED_ORG: hypothetical protein M2215_000235 [Bradyrhizobium japonicum]|uniref:Uncharacterized protein n=1 Tax=Bradyrhizobium diazoefficiens SEMIA 5080 TaxID=754504 RepID=A0A837CKU6_9BRAD|nr:hypothetical protein [Bradyrhizobium sp. CCBAU 45394]APO53523.1 hypothetical protein BD122_24665 [Bradyrhizobium diazoefficiens]KGJ69954.1 hypothetical protein BJA5080_04280 [Bradyrhizobium diazoefficiens SEMIA 5080]KOY10552.1 hypothetical protein AF336_06145 [Bradyrhizobium diazoefficiens]MDA9396144.1 hypothetical protein [Bradyrhizobium sp. CCBAU 45394]